MDLCGQRRGKGGYEESERAGEFWRCTPKFESDTRLRAARGIAKNETEAAIEAFEQLKKSRGHPHSPPPLVSDGWGGYAEANLVEVWGKVPEYKGRGRPPTKKKPQAGWRYLQQMVKQRENGRVVGVKAKTIYGDEREVLELSGGSTSYVENAPTSPPGT